MSTTVSHDDTSYWSCHVDGGRTGTPRYVGHPVSTAAVPVFSVSDWFVGSDVATADTTVDVATAAAGTNTASVRHDLRHRR